MCKVFLLKKSNTRLNGKKLTDLIKTKHNSNHKTQQISLRREIIREYSCDVLGFVPVDIVCLKNGVWFSKLDFEQIGRTGRYLLQEIMPIV